MARKKVQGAPEAPLLEDTSWLDGEVQAKINTDGSIKVLSLRPGKVQLQDGRWLECHKVLGVNQETADWLLKSYPVFMKIV